MSKIRRKIGISPSGRSGLQLHFNFSEVDLSLTARTHEIERQRTITQLMMELYLMTAHNMLKKTDKLSVKGAQVQDERAGGAQQAAHYLPRQLLINCGAIQDVAAEYSITLSKHLNALFARTEKLPANYNRADSRAEMEGLDMAFLNACRELVVLVTPITPAKPPHEIIGELQHTVKKAIYTYQDYAKPSFLWAAKRLEDKLKARFILTAERVRWTEQIEILQNYEKIYGIHLSINEELTSERINGLIFTYRNYVK